MFNETCDKSPVARTEGLGCGCDPQPVVVVDPAAYVHSALQGDTFNFNEWPGWVKWAAVGLGAYLLLKKR